jgi:hypothetical protein
LKFGRSPNSGFIKSEGICPIWLFEAPESRRLNERLTVERVSAGFAIVWILLFFGNEQFFVQVSRRSDGASVDSGGMILGWGRWKCRCCPSGVWKNRASKALVTITQQNYKLPYYSLVPTFSVC